VAGTLFPRAESSPKGAAHRRAAPTARRFCCHQRIALISLGLGYHKALLFNRRIAAPRPDAAWLH
jgi:hypothetical protein